MTDQTEADVFAPPRSNVDVREGPEALWAMTWKEVRRLYMASVNIRALGILYVLGAFGVIAIGAGFAISPDAGQGMPVALGVFLVVLGLLYGVACYSCFARPGWGRWLGIVLCVISLLSFPIGTLIGIMGLIAYTQGGRLFGDDRMSHKDVVLVYKQRKKDKR